MSNLGREGVTVVEALVAVLLALLLGRVGWSVLATQRRAAEALALGAEAQEVGRTVRRVLLGELRSGWPGTDWRVQTGDSLTLRAFRGTGLVCQLTEVASQRWRVSYRGLRAPDPSKDSALVLTSRGRWLVTALAGAEVEDGPCWGEPGAKGYRLDLGQEVGAATLIRVFERGSYHLSGGAFRYRRGLAGRQPLTPERLLGPSRIEEDVSRALLFLDYRGVPEVSTPLPEAWTVWSLTR